MALPVKQQLTYWGVASVVFLLVLWFLAPVLAPFLVGGAIAYFMDPVADRLQRFGASRVVATTVISLSALLIAVLLMLAVIPSLAAQLTALIDATPRIFQRLQAVLTEQFPELLDENSVIRKAILSIGDNLRQWGTEAAKTVFTSALGVLNAVLFLVVVPVVAFYLLLDWDNMVARIDALLPRDHAPTVRLLAGRIDGVLAAFVRGQISVCIVLGVYYSVALMLAGLEFGLVVGAIAGAITFIPYIGALVGGALAIGLALFQFWGDPISIGIVAAIFALGQFLEGNVITPRLVGNSVGLHPVWLLFALSAFGSVLGFVGMLVAVPVAAAIGVIARWGIEQYQDSLLYRGTNTPDDTSPP
ncbi:Predicted PurR-regulated permease PerM [Pseudorhodobacter antarcticus]|jgi:predicted PurR-regulated permease PerM|uniref:Predicted PurR-regulated permease PerM n=1 Tax=Pseudorhodobacter antarcticus TaxID=1077947 RepID=A0A1H8I3E6_9RHOB|nr:AI-2E family transporter [Pseudorhodobacter antarcticus]SEN63290.1 Predicted PurR-regulated permease PerM [Pseudorhodobacter antarcticus]